MLVAVLTMPKFTRLHSVLEVLESCDSCAGLLSLAPVPNCYAEDDGSVHFTMTSQGPGNIIAWLELFKEHFPVITEEVDIMIKHLNDTGKTNGIVRMHDLLIKANPALASVFH